MVIATFTAVLVEVDLPQDNVSGESFFNLMVGDTLVLRDPVNCGYNPSPAQAYAHVLQAVNRESLT